jgi:hypothetical protein
LANEASADIAEKSFVNELAEMLGTLEELGVLELEEVFFDEPQPAATPATASTTAAPRTNRGLIMLLSLGFGARTLTTGPGACPGSTWRFNATSTVA